MIDTKKDPYFDDFDPKKNFTSVLFKPGFPVQARELNQIQSIQHHQMERFSEHIFKHGSMVEGQGISLSEVPFVTIQQLSPSDGLEISIEKINPKRTRLYGETSGVEATVIHIDKSLDVTTIYLNYTKTGPSGLNKFQPGEVILTVDSSNKVFYSVKARCKDCGNSDLLDIPITGTGTIWNIPDSVYYVHGYFITHEHKMLVGERHSTGSKSYEVGFKVNHTIVTVKEDPSLYDNTLGYPNLGAPGADRSQMSLIPEIRFSSNDDSEFIVLAKMNFGTVTYMKSKPEYSAIMDMIAQRTYDESGNYTVVPFRVSLRDHLNTGSNGGLYTVEQGGKDDQFVATVSPGKAYIRGYQLETIGETLVTMEKARDTKVFRSYFTQFGGLSYILIKLENGSFPIANDKEIDSIYGNLTVDLHDGPTSGGIATGNVIGYLKPYDVEIHEIGTETIYKLYYTELKMNEGKSFVQVKSIKRNGTIFFNASTIDDELTERPKIYNSNETALIWKVHNALKTTRDADNNEIRSLSYTGREKFTAVLDGNGTYTWNANKGEYFLPFNSLTTIAAFVSDVGVSEIVKLTNQVTANSDKISVNFGSSNGGKRLVLLHSVMKSGATEKNKSIIKITDNDRTVDSTGEVKLRKSDLYKIISVKKYSVTNPASKVDVDVSTLKIDNGQRDYAYIPASFKLSEVPADAATLRFQIVYEYYEHGPGDFFSIDSYSNLLADKTKNFFRSNIPVYKSKNGIEYALTDCLDFRPLVLDEGKIKIEQPLLNGQIISDIEIYLPRIDYLVANRYGVIKQLKGESSENPSPPKISPDGNEMALYEIHQQPYVLDLTNGVRTKFVENKRYTMRDIGRLEQRLKNVEYYTTFSIMEMDLEQTSVKDEFGFDRFKNGFLADNFSNFQASNLMDPEFRASIDREESTLRPGFRIFESGLEFDPSNSTNFKRHGNVVMIDYNEELLLEQPYCSKHLSVNPYFIFNKEGKVILDPPYDNWADINQSPEYSVSAELPPVETDNLLEQSWGSWTSVNKASVELGNYVTDITLKPYMRSIPVKFYATGMKKNTRLYCFFDGEDVTRYCRPLTDGGTYGNAVYTDDYGNVSGEFLIPEGKFFAGQKEFILTNDTTNSKDEDLLFTRAMSIFWSGGIDLTKQETSLNIITPLIPKPQTTPPASAAPAAPPIVYIPGNNSPPSTLAPPPPPNPSQISNQIDPEVTQTAAVRLTTSPTIPEVTGENQPDPSDCFTSLGEIYKKYDIENKAFGELIEFDRTCARKTGYRGRGSSQEVIKKHASCVFEAIGIAFPNNLNMCNESYTDPVAQSFLMSNNSFITSVDVFFQSVSNDDMIFVQITDMVNGYPTRNILGECNLKSNECYVSSNGSYATSARFPIPVYVEGGKEYAIVVGGRSPDTRVWISKLGEKDLISDTSIETQPTLGTLFKSQNGSTWTANQYEDLKFRIYRARFKHRDATFSLKNKTMIDDNIELNPFETQSGSNRVRIRCKNHAMNPGDTFKVSLGEKTGIDVQVTSGKLNIGQRLSTNTGSGVIRGIVPKGTITTIELRDIRGYFLANQPFSTDQVSTNHPTDIINSTVRVVVSNAPSSSAAGTVKTTFNPSMNGIPLGILNNNLTVVETDSAESFVVQVSQNSNMTGFTGGSAILNLNKRYDGFNVSGSYLQNGSSELWELRGTGHKMNGEFTFDDYRTMPPIAFELQKDVLLDQPYKLVNRENTISKLGGNPSIQIQATFNTSSPLESPIMNIDTFSFIGIANMVDWNEQTTFNVIPNAFNRLVRETHPREGNALFKYVTRDIVLTESALDLRLFLDVHKTETSDFDIYIKKRSQDDTTPMENINWIEINNVWKDFVCTSIDEYKEIDCTLSELMPFEFDGEKEFNTFRIKIVGRSKNTSLPPLFKMLRVIAMS